MGAAAPAAAPADCSPAGVRPSPGAVSVASLADSRLSLPAAGPAPNLAYLCESSPEASWQSFPRNSHPVAAAAAAGPAAGRSPPALPVPVAAGSAGVFAAASPPARSVPVGGLEGGGFAFEVPPQHQQAKPSPSASRLVLAPDARRIDTIPATAPVIVAEPAAGEVGSRSTTTAKADVEAEAGDATRGHAETEAAGMQPSFASEVSRETDEMAELLQLMAEEAVQLLLTPNRQQQQQQQQQQQLQEAPRERGGQDHVNEAGTESGENSGERKPAAKEAELALAAAAAAPAAQPAPAASPAAASPASSCGSVQLRAPQPQAPGRYGHAAAPPPTSAAAGAPAAPAASPQAPDTCCSGTRRPAPLSENGDLGAAVLNPSHEHAGTGVPAGAALGAGADLDGAGPAAAASAAAGELPGELSGELPGELVGEEGVGSEVEPELEDEDEDEEEALRANLAEIMRWAGGRLPECVCVAAVVTSKCGAMLTVRIVERSGHT